MGKSLVPYSAFVAEDQVDNEGSATSVHTSSDSSPEVYPVAFQEFQLYFDTIERVTDRRVSLNKFNYSVSVAIVIAIAAVANLAATTAQLRLASIMLILVAAALAILFCMFWVKQIDDAKQLNAAKFRVLSEMASRLEFDSTSGLHAKSFHPFDKEWVYLQDALTDAGQAKRLKVLKGSRAEYFVPRGFSVLFGLIIVVAALMAAVNFDRIVRDSTFEVDPLPTPSISSSR